MKLAIAVLSGILLSIPVSCNKNGNITINDNFCRTRYPVVLVHGLGFRDEAMLIKYWGKIPEHLKKRGAVVFLSHQEAFASHKANAEKIRSAISGFLLKNPQYKKVNIIAHSKGGIESRYLITIPGMSEKIASLTTIATPHRGSKIADIVMGRIKSDKTVIVSFINTLAGLMGDSRPDAYNAGNQLTSDYMKQFNKNVHDHKNVYYQSFAAEIDGYYPNPLWNTMRMILQKHDGPNDGLVSVRSAKWGTFKGIVKQGGKKKVSHADVIGLHIVTGIFSFKEEDFIAKIVHGLKMMGF